ncbi:hypothetical protein FE634_22020 [Nocardioides dongxiaopingii]|uniref:WXG100 family type VII secretion target n=1 Tax=Nocardioides sp. S-1144 TaxID=2582905 RepID=UPI001162C4F6|nr:WXG100 family type VII secretion target [Nocardioides sp. S-1144]QDH11100.1 hypothetical protein FE634_22020 [Nocardioides sp. S-1144]
MVGLVGADVEALERLSADFDAGAHELRDLAARLAGTIDAAHDWQGPDAERCKHEWGTFAQERMTGVSDALATAGRLLAENAREQERASGAGVGGATAAGYGVLSFLRDAMAVKSFLTAPLKPIMKAKALLDFVSLLRAANLGRLADSARLAEALEVFMNGSSTGGLLGRLGLPALGRLLGKAFLPVTAVTGVVDVFTGGGHDGWRGWATRGFGLAGAAGAVTLMVGGAALVATAPVTAAVAAVAVTAYGLWTAGSYVHDHWDTFKDSAARVTTAVGDAAGRAWDGVTSGYQSALGWAHGLLGGGARPAGAGA